MSVPTAPILEVRPVASPNSLEFYWGIPADNGGAPISTYTLFCSAASISSVLNPSTYYTKVTGLTNGQDYTFTLNASNQNGFSPAAPFRTVQPGTAPGGARNVVVSSISYTEAKVSWQFSTNAGESATKCFLISAVPSTTVAGVVSTVVKSAYPSERSRNITNLSSINYTFIVQAVSDAGYAFPNASTIAFIGLPAPTAITITGGTSITSTGFTINWSGGVGATSYTYTLNGNQTSAASSTSTSATFTGLTLETAYLVVVTATNGAGSVSSAGFTVNTATNALVALTASSYSGSGSWLDSSPNGRNATLETGSISKTGDGVGIILNGSTSWTFPNVAVGNSWSVSIWYQATGANVGSFPAILTQIESNYVNIIVGAYPNQPYCVGFQGNSGWRGGTSFNLTNGLWTNIQGTWDGSNMRTYINGVLISTVSLSGTALDSGQPYRIGRRWGGGNDFVVGIIGDIRIFSGVSSQAAITALYNATKATYPLPTVPAPAVNLYATTYSGSGTWNDGSGNGYNATLENGVIAKNAVGNGIVLNGSTNWTFPNPGLGNAFTFSVWFKRTGTPTNAAACVLVQQLNNNAMNVIYRSDYYAGYYNGSYRVSSTFSLNNNVWSHVICSWDGTTLITFLNGSLLNRVTPGASAVDSGLAYRIGRQWDAANYVIGEIGEVVIYRQGLNDAQCGAVYTTSSSSYQT